MPSKNKTKGSSKTETSPTKRRKKMNNKNTDDSDEDENNSTEERPLTGGDNNKNKNKNKTRTSKHTKSEKIKVFGFDVTEYLRSNSVGVFISFALGHIFFSIIFAALQEFVNSIDGFQFPQFMTIIQTATYTFCAFIEIQTMKGELGYISQPKSPIYKYIILSVLTFSGMFFTNSGLKYVSYPTRIIFKAGKPLPTMGIEMLAGKAFTKMDVLNVFILTSGITLFCFGEARDLPSFDGLGILFMSIGVLADALTSNYEKKYIFSDGASHAEAMFFASLMGTIWTFITLVATDYGKLLEALAFCAANPMTLVWLVVSSIGGYMSVVFIMLLIKCFSPTYTECVKGIRKVLSIAFSYLALSDGNKSFNGYHGFGLSLFILSSGITVALKTDIKRVHLVASHYMSRSQLLSGFMSRSDVRPK